MVQETTTIQDAKEQMQADVYTLPVKDEASQLQAAEPRLELEDALALQRELLCRYSKRKFQRELSRVYAEHDPQSFAYCEEFSTLLRSVRADVLPKYGLPGGHKGDVALALALGEHQGDNEVQAVTALIDDRLYSGEAPMVKDSEGLTKKSILSLCREQIAAFRQAGFQRKLGYLKAAGRASKRHGFFELEGRDKLAAAEQASILKKHGLPADRRGAHSLLQQLAQHVMDPQVAACAEAANALLGMEESARDGFTARLREIVMHDPCPRTGSEREQREPKAPLGRWGPDGSPDKGAVQTLPLQALRQAGAKKLPRRRRSYTGRAPA